MKGELNFSLIRYTALVVLLVGSTGAALAGSLFLGWSVLAGGVLVLVNLWVSGRAVEQVATEVVAVSGDSSAEQQKELAMRKKRGFQFAFLLRFIFTGVALFVLIKWRLVNILGLISGLSTVFATFMALSIAMVVRYLIQKNQGRKD